MSLPDPTHLRTRAASLRRWGEADVVLAPELALALEDIASLSESVDAQVETLREAGERVMVEAKTTDACVTSGAYEALRAALEGAPDARPARPGRARAAAGGSDAEAVEFAARA